MSALVQSSEPQPELGPAMRALPLRWQRAVTALFVTKGNRSAALRAAGYKAKPNSLHVLASRIFADDRVRAAVRECAARMIEIAEPELLATTLDTAIADLYARCRLKMMREPASLPGKTGVEARSLEGSIAEIDMREQCGAWKVSRRCRYYLEERRMYHRKEGDVVALHDDTLCAARYAYMMRRNFKDRIAIGGGAVGTAAYSQWMRKQAAVDGDRFARGSAHHKDGPYDLFSV